MNNGNHKKNETEQRLERLQEATGTSNLTEFADIIGIKPQSVSGAIKRDKIPGDWIEEVAKKYNVSTDWLLFGIGQMKSNINQEAANIKLIEATLHPGPGSFWEKTTIKNSRNIPGLASEYASKMFYLSIYDESMNPTLYKGDLVQVLMDSTKLYPRGLYAISYNDLIHIRRAQSAPGKWFFKADNKEYSSDDFEYKPEDNTVQILGWVLGWTHVETDGISENYEDSLFHPARNFLKAKQ